MSLLLELARAIRHAIPISLSTVMFALFGAGLAVTSRRWVVLRTGWRPLPTLCALLALAGTLALTLSPRGWRANHRTLAQCLPADWTDLAHSVSQVGGSVESLLNILLLTPLGFTLVLASRRAYWPAAAMVLLPAVLELGQVGIRGRQCTPTDWAANALGGLLGVLAAVLVQRWLEARPPASPSPP